MRFVFVTCLALLALTGCSACKPNEPKLVRSKPSVLLTKLPEPERTAPKPDALQREKDFRTRHTLAGIAWNEKTGYAREVGSIVTEPIAAADATSAALQFLVEEKALFGIQDPAAQLVVSRTDIGHAKLELLQQRFVRFRQVQADEPVFGGEVVVAVSSDNRILRAVSAFVPITLDPAARSISTAQAEARARAEVPAKDRGASARVSKIVIPMETTPAGTRRGLLGWRVEIGDWLVLLDGAGVALYVRDTRVYGPDARIFLENQEINGGNTSIESITNVDESGFLRGTRFHVHNGVGADAQSAAREFRDEPNNAHFDEQMAYYHLEKGYTFFNHLNVANPASALVVTTRAAEAEQCNAFYGPMTDTLAFGTPSEGGCDTKCRSPGQFADVIYHELTHRVLSVTGGVTGEGVEPDGIHEGTADYYSATILGNSCLAESLLDGTDCMRDLNVWKTYPKDMIDEAHGAGEVWGSALWTLRRNDVVGEEIADRIIRQGMNGLPAAPRYHEYAGNIITQGATYYLDELGSDPWKNFFLLIAAEAARTGGQQAFCRHGIAAQYGPFLSRRFLTPEGGASVTETIQVPAGMAVDVDRGCQKGFDRFADNWQDMKTFDDNKGKLEQFSETLTDRELTIQMKAPGGCGGVPRVWISYNLYYKPTSEPPPEPQ